MIFRAITLISCGIIGGWLGWMASDRQKPVRYYRTEIANEPKPGTSLRVKHAVWRERACKTTVYRLIFDKSDHRFVVPDLEFPAGILPLGNDSFITTIPVSAEAESGHGVYRVVHVYRCNLLHWIWPIEDGPHDIPFMISAKQ